VSFDPAVRIVVDDPRWAERAQWELHRIGQILGPAALRLEHVGSTAVPGLAAKPILDLLVSVAALEPHRRYVEPLEGLGYLFVPDPDSPDRRFFCRPPERPRSHHVHVCAAGSHCEVRHIAVRDFLRAHPDEAASYAKLKHELVRQHPGDRPAYIAGKDGYVGELETRAVEWAKRGAARGARWA
jgi:GrpB-like predicted nucleotidyltransferase (UPF0157 family)